MKIYKPVLFLFLCSMPLLPAQELESRGPTTVSRTLEDAYLTSQRRAMAEELRTSFNITDEDILAAFQVVPRHLFIPENVNKMAYKQSFIPLGGGQILPEPFLLAKILINLKINNTSRVLIAGNSTPYATALIASLSDNVFQIEGVEKEYQSGKLLIEMLGFKNITSTFSNSYTAFNKEGPFDSIFVHGGINNIPTDILSQLEVGGRLICSLADPSGFQLLLLIEKKYSGLSISSIGQSFFPSLNFK